MTRFSMLAAVAVLAIGGSSLILAQNNPAAARNPEITQANFLAPAATPAASSGRMEMYWIDVEGGAATLIVSPSGESLLIDTGFPGNDDRDAKRVYAATQLAGLKKIDHLVISHYHADHVGGLDWLAQHIPIEHYYDHGEGIEPENIQWLNSEKTNSAGKRTIVKPGDEIPFKGVKVQVVASDMKIITKSINGGGALNPLCQNAEKKEPVTPENQRVVGVLVTYKKFKYLNLIDLDWEKDMELACPRNLLGEVTVYQTSRHGSLDGAGSPPFLGAIKPQVVIVNNGPRKGLGQVDPPKSATPPGVQMAPYEHVSYLRLAGIPGIEGIWQMHLSLLDSDPHHNTSPDMIANFEETKDCKGNWIKASVESDGKFTFTNGRNGFSKTYIAR